MNITASTTTNNAPTLDLPTDNFSTNEGESFNFVLPTGTFSDLDAGDTLTYTAMLADGTILPDWLTFDAATGTFSGTPSSTEVGDFSLLVTATDLAGATSDADLFTLTVAPVIAPPVNHAPIIDEGTTDYSAIEGTPFTYILSPNTFIDIDPGDTLTYQATMYGGAPLPSWLSFDADTLTFSGTPTGESDGFFVTLSATDSAGATAKDGFYIGVDRLPTLDKEIEDLAVTQDTPFSFVIPTGTFSDVDDLDALTYTATLADGTTLPDWLTFDAATQTFSGTPGQDDLAPLELTVTATDSYNKSVADTFNLTVAPFVPEPPIDTAPILVNPISDLATIEGSEFILSIADAFSDVDIENGDELTYSATLADGSEVPTWLKFDAATGNFSGTPGGDDLAPLELTVTATDKFNKSVSDNFNLTVTSLESLDSAPTLFKGVDDLAATEGSEFTFTIPEGTFTDSDVNDTLTYGVKLAGGDDLPTWLKFDAATGNFTGTPGEDDLAPLELTITATDKFNKSVSDNFNLTITPIVPELPIDPTLPNPPTIPTGIIPGLSIANNLIQTNSAVEGFSQGFGISAVSKKNDGKVNEVAIFAVEDLNGIAPGEKGYIEAVLKKATSIFTSLDGDFFSQDKQEIGLDPNKTYQFIEIENGSLAGALQQLRNGETPKILFSQPDPNGFSPIKVTESNSGYTVAVNNDELVLNVSKLAGSAPKKSIGSDSQGSAEGRTIDLSQNPGQFTVDVTTRSSAAYENHIGFYAVEDKLGGIKIASGEIISVNDSRYAAEAVKSAMNNALQADKNESKVGLPIEGGKNYAPVLISQGNFDSFLSKNATNAGGSDVVHAYFNYLGASPDGKDHFRLIGANTFGVEDMYGGGDRDFNDLTIKMTVKAA